MIKKLYIALCIAVALAGLAFAATAWMRRYVEVSPVQARLVEVNGIDGKPLVDPAALPKLYPAGEFSFTDKDGSTVTSENLKGKIWVGYLFFSSCPAQCPIMTTNLRKVAEPFASDDRVAFAGFSVDPKRDTPEQLTRFAAQYKADNPRWHMLGGPIEAIEKLAVGGFHLGSVDDPQFHSDKFVLVDGDGMVRAYFTGIDETEIPKVQDAIKQLLGESSPKEKQS